MFEDARKYLAKVLPWPEHGGAEYINIHNSFTGKKPDKPGWGGRAARSLDEAINYIDYSLKQDSTLGIYTCMSTQAAAEPAEDKRGSRYYKAKRSAEAALRLKSLFLDCDFKGGEHGYETAEDALAALAQFLKATGLPKPSCIVHSGGGLHTYWTFDRALTPAEWYPLACALAEATKAHGFKCDTQCTVDAARILRVPDTLNKKLATPRPVKLLYATEGDYAVERLESALAPYVSATARVLPATGGMDPILFPPKPPVENELGAGIEKEEKLFHLDDISRECAFVRDAALQGGATYSQPLWNLTSLIATFTDDPVGDIHRMSDKHPTYTKEQTDEMLTRKQRERETKGLGWPSCSSISAAGCTACQSCAHFSKGKTPLHFAVQAAPVGAVGSGVHSAGVVTPQVTQLPDGYFLNQRGLISRAIGDEGSITVAEYSMEDPQLHSNSPEQFSFLSQIERGKKRRIYINLQSIGAMDMRATLHGQGFMLSSGAKQVNMVSDFMASWIKVLRETRDSVQSNPFGWAHTSGDKPDGFAFDSTLWTPTGPRAVSCGDPELTKNYKPTGKDDPWLACARLVTNQKRPALNAIVATAFGGPLVKLTGHPGVIISAYNKDTGIGKSTAAAVATAVWGDPKSSQFGVSATEYSVMHTMGQVKSLPLYWDEVQSEAQLKGFVDITFATAGGVGRKRLNKNIQLRDSGKWQTLLVLVANYSLVDHITGKVTMTAAGMYRVFEFKVPPPTTELGQIATPTADGLVDKLKYNFGTIGLKYAQWLGTNYDRAHADMTKLLLDLEKKYSIAKAERFWMASLGSMILGARYANELGFTEIDEQALEHFLCVDAFAKMREDATERPVNMDKVPNVVEVLQGFFGSIRGKHLLVTNKVHTLPGRAPKDSIKVAATHCDPSRLDSIYAQFGVDDKTWRISKTALSTWLRSSNYMPGAFIDALGSTLGASMALGKLAAGVSRFQCLPEQIITLNANKHPELDLAE